MKYIAKHMILGAVLGLAATACSDFEPTGFTGEVVSLEKATSISAEVNGHEVTVNWTLPDAEGIEGVTLLQNAANPIELPATTTSYLYKGQQLVDEYVYTIKVRYEGGLLSQGISTKVTLPAEELPGVTDLKSSVKGRKVTLSWNLPDTDRDDLTGIRVVRDGDVDNAKLLDPDATTVTLAGQPFDTEMTYSVEAMYDVYYPSEGAKATLTIPFFEQKSAFLLLASSADALPDDDERAAAKWFAAQENCETVTLSQLPDLDSDIYAVLWVMVDRVGLPAGWKNLPDGLADDSTIAALKNYSTNGGSLYLSNMATQLTVPLGYVSDAMAPGIFNSGEGGSGDDIWTINPYLGWDYRDGAEEGFYDRTSHAIFKGLTLEDPNNFGYESLPLIGPGIREDHNCMWDCNVYGKGDQRDVIANFEVTANCMVLATWGQVRDHCVAGLVDFYATANRGRCVANGFAAYEWNQNSGTNPYQANVEKLTTNILDYLK